ncbi:hypothetical protein LUZ60_012548 [Juncus effusus]|nr:hypothetical protein LUZ60_012548 [Juncus effusus]
MLREEVRWESLDPPFKRSGSLCFFLISTHKCNTRSVWLFHWLSFNVMNKSSSAFLKTKNKSGGVPQLTEKIAPLSFPPLSLPAPVLFFPTFSLILSFFVLFPLFFLSSLQSKTLTPNPNSTMQWQMEEVESVLEKIWDLHDKVSDAIHSISRSRFLKSIGNESKPFAAAGEPAGGVGADRRSGFVFVKGLDDGHVSMAEARSLNAIRAALEDLEDQLEFFHTVQSQQQAERDSAISRLEQSRAILAMRLAEHQGKKFKVIEEALAFVSDSKTNNFISPQDLCTKKVGNNEGFGVLIGFLSERVRGVLGNAAVFAISMLALIQLNQMVFRGGKNEGKRERGEKVKSLDVFLARG